MSETTRKLTAILFTDIVGFTALMRADEKKALNLLYYNRQLLEPIIKRHNGEILKEMGDGTLNSFPSAIEAVRCALEIQEMLEAVPALNLRIGVHIGDVIEEGDDIFGDGVNIASRIQGLAEPGGICLSQAVYDSIQSQADIRAKSIGKRELKGIEGEQEIYTLISSQEQFQAASGNGDKTEKRRVEEKFHFGALFSWIGGTIISIIIIFQVVAFITKPQTTGNSNSIAVFPFDNILKNDEFDWLSDGFARTLTFKLSKVEVLQVIDQLQVLKTIDKVQPQAAGIGYELLARKTAEKMNINLLLLGSYQIYGDKIQITTKLVDVESGIVKPLIMETYSLEDPLSMQSDISDKISVILKSKNNSIN